MGGSNTWRTNTNGEDWMRDVEKRVLHEERRPQIRTASDLMGPGLGPFAVQVMDWNAPETAYNGFFFSTPTAINTPDSTRYWMGVTEGNVDGYGTQRVYEVSPNGTATVPPVVYIRTFWPGFQRQFSAWAQLSGGGGTAPHELPLGGTTGQQLVKKSGTDYDVQWADGTQWVTVVNPATDLRPAAQHVMWVGGLTKPANMLIGDLWVKGVAP